MSSSLNPSIRALGSASSVSSGTAIAHAHSQVHLAAWSIEQLVCWSLVVLVVFINGADFRGGTGEEFEVHWQIYLRLMVSFACGCVGALYFPSKTVRDFLAWPGLLIAAYVGWYGLTLPTSIEKTYSAAAWVSLVGVLLLIPAAMRVLGGYRFLMAVASGLTLYLIGSWIAYLFVPEVGVFQEQITMTYVYERMGGLGHPNELGFYSAFTILVFAGLAVSGRMSWMFAGLGMLLGAITLFTCFSRTSTITCALGLMLTFQAYWRRPGNAIGVVLAIGLGVLVVFAAVGAGELDWFIESTLTKLTKSGSTDELSTATGRTDIWAYGSKKIGESPLVGYGYCTARFVMDEHSFHCHNIVLNAAMYGGVVAGLIVICMVFVQLAAMIYDPIPAIDGLILLMCVAGMVDELLGVPSPAASVTLWFSLLLWRQLGMQLDPTPNRQPA